MCAPDPNRMARWQAKVEHRKKFTQWHSETLKYKNRATSYHRGIDRIAMGHSRAKSDLAQKTRWTIGKLREKQQENYIAYAQKQSVDEGGRSWRARNLDQNYKKLLKPTKYIFFSIIILTNNSFKPYFIDYFNPE